MVGAKAAVVRTTEMGAAIESPRHFAAFSIVTRIAVVFGIGRDQHFFRAVFRATLEHKNQFSFEHDFGIYPAQTMSAET